MPDRLKVLKSWSILVLLLLCSGQVGVLHGVDLAAEGGFEMVKLFSVFFVFLGLFRLLGFVCGLLKPLLLGLSRKGLCLLYCCTFLGSALVGYLIG